MVSSILHVDFETRSPVDLRKTGVHKYAEHPDTGIWLASYAFDDEEPATIWFEGPLIEGVYGRPLVERGTALARIEEHIASGGIIYAHNAEFERVMWRDVGERKYGLPPVAREQWFCTAAEAAAMSLPRHLDGVTRALGLEHKKDAAGGRIMLQLARPRRTEAGRPVWWDDREKLARLAAYGLDDVRAERGVYNAVNRLSPRERRLYLLDQVINDRGIGLDVPLARAMKSLAEQEIDVQNAKMYEATEGAVSSITKVAQIKAWIQAQGIDGVDSIRKSAIKELLDRPDLPDAVVTVLSARADAAKSSLKKLDAELAVAGVGDRMRGTMLFHGASTGRWTGRHVQPHNFTRGEVPNIEDYIESVIDGSIVGAPGGPSVLTVLSSMMRSTIVPAPGHDLVVADYSGIELRVNAWQAGETDLLAAIRDGRPIYEEMAARIYDRPVGAIEKGTIEYQIGKNTILGAGYGMGGKARCKTDKVTGEEICEPSKFRTMVIEQTGVDIGDEFAERSINAFRNLYPNIVNSWYDTERAAIAAVEAPGSVHTAGPAKFTRRGAYLWLVLPSKRALAYFAPRIVERETPWGSVKPAVEVSHQNQVTRQWERTALYGGLLVENIVQAISRDVMAEGMLAVEEAGYPVVFTVHDEIVAEPVEGFGTAGEFMALLTREPEWAPGLPLTAKGWRGKRYRK